MKIELKKTIVPIIALLILGGAVYMLRPESPVTKDDVDKGGKENRKAGSSSAGSPEKVAPATGPIILEYGAFVVTTDKLSGVKVGPGEHVLASPIANVDYSWYVNGELFMEIVGGKQTRFGVNDPDIREHGYRLKPGAGIKSLKWVYVKYKGDTDPDDGWFKRAQQAVAAKQ